MDHHTLSSHPGFSPVLPNAKSRRAASSTALLIMLLLAACVQATTATPSVESSTPETATPSPTASRTAVAALPSATAVYGQGKPFGWLEQQVLLFQPGDLPNGVQPSGFTQDIPGSIQSEYGAAPDGAASLELVSGASSANYGSVSLFLYKNPAVLNNIFQKVIQSEDAHRQGQPQAGIGLQAYLYPPDQPGSDMTLYFSTCRVFVEIHLLQTSQKEVLLQYGRRLAERVNVVDCQGQSNVPQQTPPLSTTGTDSTSSPAPQDGG